MRRRKQDGKAAIMKKADGNGTDQEYRIGGRCESDEPLPLIAGDQFLLPQLGASFAPTG